MRTENNTFFIDQPHKLSLKEKVKLVLYPFYNLYLKFLSLFFKTDQRDTKYEVSICSCFKNEAPFLKEWIEYHRLIGFDHFYLYNNNSTDNYREVLTPYIEDGIVTLKDFTIVPVQVPAYHDFYVHHRQETKWVALIDLDEFFCLFRDTNIKSWISRFSKYPVVCTYWKFFNSSGLLEHDFSKLVMEQYILSSEKYINIGKCFINTRFQIDPFERSMIHFPTVLWRGLKIPAINEAGNYAIWGIQKIKPNQFTIQINHYWSKAFYQYISKYRKGSGASGLMWKKIEVFKGIEHYCTVPDYKIMRFLTETKLRMKGIDENKVLDQ